MFNRRKQITEKTDKKTLTTGTSVLFIISNELIPGKIVGVDNSEDGNGEPKEDTYWVKGKTGGKVSLKWGSKAVKGKSFELDTNTKNESTELMNSNITGYGVELDIDALVVVGVVDANKNGETVEISRYEFDADTNRGYKQAEKQANRHALLLNRKLKMTKTKGESKLRKMIQLEIRKILKEDNNFNEKEYVKDSVGKEVYITKKVGNSYTILYNDGHSENRHGEQLQKFELNFDKNLAEEMLTYLDNNGEHSLVAKYKGKVPSQHISSLIGAWSTSNDTLPEILDDFWRLHTRIRKSKV